MNMENDVINLCVSYCVNNLMPWVVLLAFVIWPIVCIHGTLYDLKREDTHFALLFFKNFVSSITVFLGFTLGGFCVLFLGSIACGMVWGMWNYAMTCFQ